MAIIKQHLPVCDVCEDSFPDMMVPDDTVTSCRKRMKDSGWKRKDGKDICPDCVADAYNFE